MQHCAHLTGKEVVANPALSMGRGGRGCGSTGTMYHGCSKPARPSPWLGKSSEEARLKETKVFI